MRYGLLCNEDGGVVDDVTIYRLGDDALFLCVNASNIEKDYRWIVRHAGDGATVDDRSDASGCSRSRGRRAAAILAKLATLPPDLKHFRFVEGAVAGAPALISRTGYTGADGFELYVAADDRALVGTPCSRPAARWACALRPRRARHAAARGRAAALRSRARRHDVAARGRAGRFVKREAGGFLGAEAIERRAQGPPRARSSASMLEERGIARSDHRDPAARRTSSAS